MIALRYLPEAPPRAAPALPHGEGALRAPSMLRIPTASKGPLDLSQDGLRPEVGRGPDAVVALQGVNAWVGTHPT